MKIIRFYYKGCALFGLLNGDKITELKGDFESLAGGNFAETGKSFNLGDVKLLAPCVPSKVVCVGLNYRGHAKEMRLPLPEQPILFIKPSTAVIGHGEVIIRPTQSRRVDYEAELGIVIGKRAYHIKKEEALDYVLGYTCANDVTARDLQPADGQWTYAKGFDTFSPIGPWIETEVDDPNNLNIKGLLNGKQVQSSNTSDLVFCIQDLIVFISGCMTLLPGDVIMTGTPSGIGPMNSGDIIEIDIESVGRLSNHVR